MTSGVTAHLLKAMLEVVSVEQLIKWTGEPKRLPVIPFGKHRNEKWAELPPDYLDWLVKQTDIDPDVLWNAKIEQARRAQSS